MQTATGMKCLICGAVVETTASRFCSSCRGGSQSHLAKPLAFPVGMPPGPEPRRHGSWRRRGLVLLIGVVAVLGAGTVLVQALDPDRYLQGSTWEQDEIDHFRADVQDGARNAGAEIPAGLIDCVVAEVTKHHTPDEIRRMDTDKAEELGATFALGCIDALGYGSTASRI